MKNKGGRPLAFETNKELKKAVDAYFKLCDGKIRKVYNSRTKEVEEIGDPEPYTMSGLAYVIGVDRRTLINYSNRNKFFLTIKEARRKVESDVERRSMSTPYQSGCIFNLKNNFNWKDRIEKVEGSPKEFNKLDNKKAKKIARKYEEELIKELTNKNES